MTVTAARVRFQKLTSHVGAVVNAPDLDLSRPLAPETATELRQGLLDNGVIFFRNQELTDRQMEVFVSQFGEPIPEPFVSKLRPDAPPAFTGDLERTKHATCVWHHDTSFLPEPPMFTALRAVSPPEFGGDTCWSSMVAAYETLSAPIRRLLDGLSAVHSVEPVYRRMGSGIAGEHADNESLHDREFSHPLVLVHPETNRKALFYNEGWTSRVVGLSQYESEHLIALLREHCKSVDFAMRWRWQPNDLALWDNRSVQHYAVPDYSTSRIMQRVVTKGERPVGPQG